MKTLHIDILNPDTLKLLKDLESMNLIKILSHSNKSESSTPISKKLIGSLNQKKAHKMEDELNQMKDEWNRDI